VNYGGTFSVTFGDPNCSGFQISCGKQRDKQRDRQTNAAETRTPVTAVGVDNNVLILWQCFLRITQNTV